MCKYFQLTGYTQQLTNERKEFTRDNYYHYYYETRSVVIVLNRSSIIERKMKNAQEWIRTHRFTCENCIKIHSGITVYHIKNYHRYHYCYYLLLLYFIFSLRRNNNRRSIIIANREFETSAVINCRAGR